MPLWVRTIRITALPDDARPLLEAHRAHLRALKESGKLRAAGAFRRDDGFLEIFEAKDLYEAEGIARSSPLVEAGLAVWTLREWEEIPA